MKTGGQNRGTVPETVGVTSRVLSKFLDFPHLLTYNSATTFHIENHADIFDDSIRSFCIEASSLSQNAVLQMRPCDENEILQMWFMDSFGQIRPKDKDLLCVLWEKKELTLSPNCKSDFYTSFFDSTIYRFNFGHQVNAIYANKSTGRQYIGVKIGEPFTKLRLYGPLNTNQSLTEWTLKWVIYESQEPSVEPSSTPTLSQTPSLYPTTSPSSSPSAMPSPSPTAKPSPSPSLSQMPSMEPSLLPSDEVSIPISNIVCFFGYYKSILTPHLAFYH